MMSFLHEVDKHTWQLENGPPRTPPPNIGKLSRCPLPAFRIGTFANFSFQSYAIFLPGDL